MTQPAAAFRSGPRAAFYLSFPRQIEAQRFPDENFIETLTGERETCMLVYK